MFSLELRLLFSTESSPWVHVLYIWIQLIFKNSIDDYWCGSGPSRLPTAASASRYSKLDDTSAFNYLFIHPFSNTTIQNALNPQESAYDAYYRLSDPRGQIQSYVFDVVRSTVPRLELDEAFASKDEVAAATMDQLQSVMKDYGYEILNTLVTDLSPDARVKASMNEINASKRLKEAASHKAEADKVQQVKAAEADAEARYLSGLGVARQRKAIVKGLQASISEFSDEVDGVTSKDVMDILLLTQYFDTLKDVGASNMILEHEPASVNMLQSQVNRTLGKKKAGFLSWTSS